jgi:hypothetical protein
MHAALRPIICAFGDYLSHRLRRSRSTFAIARAEIAEITAIIENGKDHKIHFEETIVMFVSK